MPYGKLSIYNKEVISKKGVIYLEHTSRKGVEVPAYILQQSQIPGIEQLTYRSQFVGDIHPT